MSLTHLTFVAAALVSLGAASPLTVDATFITPPAFHTVCSNPAPGECLYSTDSCCAEGANNIIVVTGTWNYTNTVGPADIFLLKDFRSESCSGVPSKGHCNPSWEITDPVSLLQSQNRTDLLAEMYTNWKSPDGNDPAYWAQQFNQYGTCMGTLNPTCYSTTAPKNTNAIDYFAAGFNMWKYFPTYNLLVEAGITPSSTQTHTVTDFKSFLTTDSWITPGIVLGCDESNALVEISYYFWASESIPDLHSKDAYGPYTPSHPDTCTDGFKWLPKTVSTNNARAVINNVETGNFNAINNTDIPFCLLSDGTLGSVGSCADFTATGSPSAYTLSTPAGNCNVVNNILTCGADVTAGGFTISEGFLAYNGEAVWFGSEDDSAPVNLGGSTSTYELSFSTVTTTATSASSAPASTTSSSSQSTGSTSGSSSSSSTGSSAAVSSSVQSTASASSSSSFASSAASSSAQSTDFASLSSASSSVLNSTSSAIKSSGSTIASSANSTKLSGTAASSSAATETDSASTVTTVVSEYTTYCPESTTFTHGSKTYTVTDATTLTITDCPCTITTTVPCSSESESSKETEAPEETSATEAPKESSATTVAPKENNTTSTPKESTTSSQVTPTQVAPTEAPTEPIRNSASTQIVSVIFGLAIAAAPLLL